MTRNSPNTPSTNPGLRTPVAGASPLVLLLAVVLLVMGALPAAADWLVLDSGDEVETKGSWTVQGGRVIFTTPRGSLSSVRVASVDIDASRKLSEKKSKPEAKPAEAEERAPVLVLTDGDLPEFEAVAVVASEDDVTGDESPSDSGAVQAASLVPSSDRLEIRPALQLPGTSPVEVVSWIEDSSGDGEVTIRGSLRNSSPMVASVVVVTVSLLDSDGGLLARSDAELSTTAIMPGAGALYEGTFLGTFGFGEVQFSTTSLELEVRPDAQGATPPEV